MHQIEQITPSIYRFEEACNVYVVTHEGRALLIDCGGGDVRASLQELGVTQIDWVLFTHHHRDQCFGASKLVADGTRLAVPQHEVAHFAEAEAYWQQKRIYDNYNDRNTFFTLGKDLPVAAVLEDYETFAWGPHTFAILPTPGHTHGSIALLATIDGQHVAFTGDLMHDGGKLYQLHAMEYDYGDMIGVNLVAQSLQALARRNVDLALPSHGPVIRDPAGCISRIDDQLHALARLEGSRCGLTGDGLFAHEIKMEALSPHLLWGTQETCSNFYVIRSDSGKALFIDYPYASHSLFMSMLHSSEPQARLRFIEHHLDELREEWGINAFDVVIPTHIHDDHVCGIPFLQRHHGTACWAQRDVAKVLADPERWNTPCLLKTPIDIDRALGDGERFRWQEFDIEIVHYPGQTEFHAAILAEVDGRRVIFSGDSTYPMTIRSPEVKGQWWVNGIMRNSVTLEMHRKCADEFERLNPDFLCPGHGPCWDVPATAAAEQRDFVRRKEEAWKALVPEPPDLAIDLFWARLLPYQVRLVPGAIANFSLEIRNPYGSATKFTAQLQCETLELEGPARDILVDGGEKATLALTLPVPSVITAEARRRHLVTVCIDAAGTRHGPVGEALLVVGHGDK